MRIGVLGAARIAPMALVRPAGRVPGAEVVAVAARDPERARRFARRHGVPRVHESYDALLADPEIDAVYNPLPNALHAEWSIRALRAGKHVLCEKPLASNADEAARMAEAADESGRILVEAFHWRYHPLAARARELLDAGAIGPVRTVETAMCVPLPLPGDIRYRWELAGGATMDVGCYAVDMLRFFAGEEPEEVLAARARLASPRVDRCMEAFLRFPSGATGRIQCSLFSSRLLRVAARVIGERGELRIRNPVAPHLHHRLVVRTPEGRRVEKVAGDATYTHQLRAFVDQVRGGTPMSSDARSGVRNMRVIDAIYEAAGLPRRGAPASG